jgi:osmoprotectant transport system ATP-binding protein
MAIEFRSVTKRFADGTTAVDDFSLVLPAHKTTVFVGSSGCGKTTLLRMINRLIEPTSGEITIDGEPIRERDPVRCAAASATCCRTRDCSALQRRRQRRDRSA